MDGKNTEQVSQPSEREDDRNEVEEGSPVPDPEQEDDADAADIPTAD